MILTFSVEILDRIQVLNVCETDIDHNPLFFFQFVCTSLIMLTLENIDCSDLKK